MSKMLTFSYGNIKMSIINFDKVILAYAIDLGVTSKPFYRRNETQFIQLIVNLVASCLDENHCENEYSH